MAERSPSSSPSDPELDAVDTMELGSVLQLLVDSYEDRPYVIAAGTVFRDRLKMKIRMARARTLDRERLFPTGTED